MPERLRGSTLESRFASVHVFVCTFSPCVLKLLCLCLDLVCSYYVQKYSSGTRRKWPAKAMSKLGVSIPPVVHLQVALYLTELTEKE